MKHLLRIAALAAVALATGCGVSDLVGPDEAIDAYVESLDLPSFQSLMASEELQVEVVVLPGGLTAGRLVVRPSRSAEEERVQSRAVAISGDVLGGRVTLLLGELDIAFDPSTRFWIGDHEVGMEDFLAEVRADLEEGQEPGIVAERPVPAMPQDPDDGSFLAAAIAVTGDGAARLRLEVDADNLELTAEPSGDEPDGWLDVLGLQIQLRVRDGMTELESHDHDFEEVEDFEAVVASVSLDARTVTLADGVVVRLVDRTRIATGERLIGSLEGVAEAVALGGEVVAWGEGAVRSEEPPVLEALKIAFAERTDEEPHGEEFEGVVAGVSPDAGTFELADGTVVRIVEGTELVAYDDHSPSSLGGVVEALDAGMEVLTWGSGEVASEEPLTIEGARVVFKAREPDQARSEFEGAVARVELVEGAVVMDDGTKIVVTDDTEVVAYHDQSPPTLEALAAALEDGVFVRAWGAGVVGSEEPIVIVADRIVLRAVVEDFERDVEEIDATAGTVVLEGGWLLTLTETTGVAAADESSPSTLEGAAEALAAGDRVRVWGWGFVTGEEPVSLRLGSLTIRRIPVG